MSTTYKTQGVSAPFYITIGNDTMEVVPLSIQSTFETRSAQKLTIEGIVTKSTERSRVNSESYVYLLEECLKHIKDSSLKNQIEFFLKYDKENR